MRRGVPAAALLLLVLLVGTPRITRAMPATPTPIAEFGLAPIEAPADLAGSRLAFALAEPGPGTPLGTPGASGPPSLGSERARILLQSLTVPGWGQATLGRHTAATVFGLVELGIWTSFVAFKTQESMRADTYVRTAQLYAGIDLNGRDDEFRHVVGQYPSSDDYNKFVVYRDAANLYYGDPAAMDAYIRAHSLTGKDSWAWQSEDSYTRYQEERKATQRAGLRANTALGLAVANRIISALHAARYAGQPSTHALRFEIAPEGDRLEGGRFALTTHF